MKKLENKIAIITGGSGSIGKTVAKLFLEEGATVMLVGTSEEKLQKTVQELKSEHVQYCVANVSKLKDVAHYISETVKHFGKIDVFFNNAGIEGVVKPIVDYPEKVFDEVIAVNVKGMWLGNQHALPQMNDGGSIIMTSSVAGIIGFAGLGAYVTSKHAVVGIMKTSAIEAAPRKIRVNSVHPAPVNNQMMRSIEDGASAGHGDKIKKQFEATIPLGRYAEPIEIAKLVLFLASDDSQYITGTTQIIDGGMCAQ
ncbi:SDR family NAD(P)-dependent oxidoreductase [Flavobacterium myungsuense]|uniref:SDR family NAD(P)-dependent oxidoreductase n=1 Tax=Flavobacterium myungsuense TaxID=651823 RepID=A0ABW3J1B2_9FLAO